MIVLMQNYPASALYLSVHLNHKTEASVCLYAFVWLATYIDMFVIAIDMFVIAILNRIFI